MVYFLKNLSSGNIFDKTFFKSYYFLNSLYILYLTISKCQLYIYYIFIKQKKYKNSRVAI